MNKANSDPEFAAATCLDPTKPYARQSEALAAAVCFALASPEREHVHRLRTATRRMEAQLALLAAIPGGAPGSSKFEKAAGKLGRTLKQVRRAAGAVRDLDVQGKSLQELVEQEPAEQEPAEHELAEHGLAEHGLAEHELAEQEPAGVDGLRDDTERLSHWLKQRRSAAAQELQRALGRSQNKLVRRMDAVAGALEPGLSLTPSELEQQIRRWYQARAEEAPRTPDALHAIRKVAKLARYMGEANGSKALAEQFEALQESGGAWHDLLTLSIVARKRLGKRSPLARLLRERCAEAHRGYCKHLARFAV